LLHCEVWLEQSELQTAPSFVTIFNRGFTNAGLAFLLVNIQGEFRFGTPNQSTSARFLLCKEAFQSLYIENKQGFDFQLRRFVLASFLWLLDFFRFGLGNFLQQSSFKIQRIGVKRRLGLYLGL